MTVRVHGSLNSEVKSHRGAEIRAFAETAKVFVIHWNIQLTAGSALECHTGRRSCNQKQDPSPR